MYNYNYLRNSYQMNRNNNMNDFDTNYDDFMTNVPSVNNNFQNQVTNNNSPVTLFTPSEGVQKGNLFSNLYSEYDNYQPVNLTATTDQQKLYLDMAENAFAAHELNLYLDINPDNSSLLTLFNDYRERANALKEEYEANYGPISISSNVLINQPFLWEETSWPWEGGMN